jgi:hypothetical protein
VELLPENDQAYTLYQKVHFLGAETVFRLMNLTLTSTDAEDILEKMTIIASVIAEWDEAQRQQGQ